MKRSISVIIPCYNAEKYLAACLESVLSQTDCALEVLLVDDGSADGTAAICDAAAQRDARVRVWHSENRGVSAARNLALSQAQGKWVTFVDADDLVPEGAFARMLDAADAQTDVVIAAHETLADDGTRRAFTPERRFDPDRPEQARDVLARRLIEGDSVYNIMCAKLHRRAHIEKQAIRLCEDVRIGEDAIFNLQSMYTARRVIYLDEICYTYRIHALSAMQQSEGHDFARMRAFFPAMGDALKRLGLYERYFPALASSAALRLYKESGLGGVIRRFAADVRPLLSADSVRGMSAFLVRSGAYPYAYVAAFPFAAVRRKAAEMVRRLRHG